MGPFVTTKIEKVYFAATSPPIWWEEEESDLNVFLFKKKCKTILAFVTGSHWWNLTDLPPTLGGWRSNDELSGNIDKAPEFRRTE